MRYLASFTMFFIAITSFAQNGQPNKIKDSLAFNVLSTVDKVLRIVENPKRQALELAGEPIKTNYNGGAIYQSSIIFPGSVNSRFFQTGTRRYEGITEWQWAAQLLEFPKGQRSAVITALQKKVDSILVSLKTRKRPPDPDGDYEIETAAWINSTYYDKDGISLIIRLKKKLHNTEQQAVDSLLRLYKPLMSDPSLARECAANFRRALDLENIAGDKVKTVYREAFKETADKNIKAAFAMLMEAPGTTDELTLMTSQLNSGQQAEIKSMARKNVEDYVAKNNNTQRDPVIEKKNEIEKVTPPSDPCKREIWELSIKPGYYISGNSRVAYVSDYSCSTNTYTIAWIDPTRNNRLIMESLSVEGMQSYRHTSSSPFLICSHCKGHGYSLEYDWYQVNVASNYYARSNDQRKYTCGVCSGAGYIKVR